MLYKFRNKKGNLTVILIGIIGVMLLMTIFLARRMTGHTQLLTISDYTQISRYFLESYVGDILQYMRQSTNDPLSDFAQKICYEKVEDLKGKNLNDFLKYEPSKMLREISKKYTPNIIFIDKYKPTIELSEATEEIGYPDGFIVPDDKAKIEKRGLIKITCQCEFNKRLYKLEVCYPFSIVFRMTPVIKDFMLFIDNLWVEQKAFQQSVTNDKLNIVQVENGKINKDSFPDCLNVRKIRPMVLLAALNRTGALLDNPQQEVKESGMVYFGPSSSGSSGNDGLDKSIFYNVSGIAPDQDTTSGSSTSQDGEDIVDISDMHIVPPSLLGLPDKDDNGQPLEISDEDHIAHFNIKGKNSERILTYGNEIDIGGEREGSRVGQACLGLLGFSKELPELLDNSNEVNKWHFYQFFRKKNEDVIKNTFWNEVYDKLDYLTYSFGIKTYGLRIKGFPKTRRQVFGNIFARFLILSLWEFERAHPLDYDPDKKIDEVGLKESLIKWLPNQKGQEDRIIKFRPPEYDDSMSEKEKQDLYQKYMSKIMSGLKANDNNYNKNENSTAGKYQNLFLPLNCDYSDNSHKIFDENNFEPNDDFKLNRDFVKFDKFGSLWFGKGENGKASPIEKRLGRVFIDDSNSSSGDGRSAEEKFKKAVGYKDSLGVDQKQKFKVNGVVFVKGDLDLSKGMDLAKDDCSGGIVVVDGNITLGNITRGQKINASKFEFITSSTGDDTASKYWERWTDPSVDNGKYNIDSDKILTFVCLGQGHKIKITGNVLLGVQLVNLTDEIPLTREGDDQITWMNPKKEIIFYGSIICNRFNLAKRLEEFGEISTSADKYLDAPFFMYPSVMATATPPLAVQINENMRGYMLSSSGATE